MEEGKTACCGATAFAPTGYKQESEPEERRRLPSIASRRQVLQRQGNACLYCGAAFGEPYFDGKRWATLAPCWDHFVPYAYARDNGDANFVAACKFCNGVKGDDIFQTVDEASIYIRQKRGLL